MFKKMNHEVARSTKRPSGSVKASCASWLCGSICLLLVMGGTARAQATRPLGLDALKDDRLINELADRGLTNLLDRAFEVDHVPAQQRAGIRAMAALQELGDSDAKLSDMQRRALLAKVAAGIEQALPALDDPETMMRQATLLIRQGIERDANALEYWPDNPQTQKELEPIVRATLKLLERCEMVAKKQADALGNQLTGPGDPRGKVWEELSNLASNAAYTRHMLMYDLALCLPARSEARLSTAGEAIDYLKQFDNAESRVQPVVRNQMAKLHMLRQEFDQAQKLFATVAEGKGITPPPDVKQQYEARYFSAVCDVLAGNEAGAEQKLDALIQWQKANLPADKQTQEGADAATAILEYRITSLHAAAATEPAQRNAAMADARKLLLALVQRRPDLRKVVLEQVASTIPADANLKDQDPLLLEAMLQRADDERLKSAGTPVDANVLKSGIAAARELLSRKHDADVDSQTLNAAALLIPLCQERLGQLVEAANGYLDYIQDSASQPSRAEMALDAAQSVIGRLRSDSSKASAQEVTRLYERFLPIATAPPFSRRQLEYEYGRLLQEQGKLAAAAAQFRMVPSKDPRVADARFEELVCIRQELDDPKLDRAERKKLAGSFSMLSQQVDALAEISLGQAANEREKLRLRGMLARSALLNADVARREQNDPKQAIEILNDFEAKANGLPGEEALLASALYTRVQACMALGKDNEATASLVKLVESHNGGEGVAIVYQLMQRLNHELNNAQATGQTKRAAVIAKNRARLSGLLVDWAEKSKDPKIRKYSYQYAVFDAAAKYLAAEMETDPAKRVAALQAAMARYRKLEEPDELTKYRATIDPNSGINPKATDPQVSLGIGLVAYDLADYEEAQKRLGELLVNRKLGSPQQTVEENGIERVEDNDQYWEATLKLLKSNLAIAGQKVDSKSAQLRQQTENYLKQLYIQWGSKVGGKKWHREFETLRTQVIPDFKFDS